MTVLVNIDGTLSPAEQATVSVLDRGFLYGDSVYEVVRTYESRIFALEEHLDRLERSAGCLDIALPTRDWLAAEIGRTVDAAGNDETYCRIIVTRGSGPITLDPTTATRSLTVLIAKPFQRFPDWTFKRGVALAIPQIRRTARNALDPAIKSGNYLNSVLALGEAVRGGYFDALMLDHQGLITEATSSNVFLARDGKLFTPELETGILAGVTRRLLLDLIARSPYECIECAVTREFLETADEVMLTSTLREVQPVVRVGDKPIAGGKPGPISADLRRRFHEYALARVRG
jgi:branched-chain amino acid aminotransferase